VRDMMEYLGFAVSYEDDEDWYDSSHFLDCFAMGKSHAHTHTPV